MAIGKIVSLLGGLLVTPGTMRKLRGAKIVARDINKPGRPEVPEMVAWPCFSPSTSARS